MGCLGVFTRHKAAFKKAAKKMRACRGRLTDAKVKEMKEAFVATVPGREIAKGFKVLHATVQNVKKRLDLIGK